MSAPRFVERTVRVEIVQRQGDPIRGALTWDEFDTLIKDLSAGKADGRYTFDEHEHPTWLRLSEIIRVRPMPAPSDPPAQSGEGLIR